ncbi:hypothetical protein F5Y16DRAFT_389695 [Xylariaceae sp. FL0255]|nr:hypothetical protein F5Y16DRAFT_389695 [Xylariaceae sp. FL0255]
MAPPTATEELPSVQAGVQKMTVEENNKKSPHTMDMNLKPHEEAELKIANEMGAPDMYIDCKKDTEWFLLSRSIYVQLLRIDNRTGMVVMKLKTEPRCDLGRHRHRGEVRAYTTAGTWGYYEHDWTAKVGDYITEMPGAIHTLWMGENSEIMFHVMGSIEFYNETSLTKVMDSFSWWRLYVEHCEKEGKAPNKSLWY